MLAAVAAAPQFVSRAAQTTITPCVAIIFEGGGCKVKRRAWDNDGLPHAKVRDRGQGVAHLLGPYRAAGSSSARMVTLEVQTVILRPKAGSSEPLAVSTV